MSAAATPPISPPKPSSGNTQNAMVSVPKPQFETQSGYPAPTATHEEVVQSSDIFWDSLKGFHQAFGSKFLTPIVGGTSLDLHRLFVEVTSRGGIEKVIRDRKWKEVTEQFKFPPTVTSPSFVLRKYYVSLLYHYEQVYYLGKQAPPTSDSGGSELQLGCSVNGTIDAKFESGYLVTVNFGLDIFKGVLYVPDSRDGPKKRKSLSLAPRDRKKSKSTSGNLHHPKAFRSSYNFFYSENYNKLRPFFDGKEKEITNRISQLWSELPEEDKQVYYDKAARDKERFDAQMAENNQAIK